MMKKLFNKKTMVLYVILLCFSFIMGCTMVGLNVHYSNEFEKATTPEGDGTTQAIVNGLSSLISSIAGEETADKLSDALSSSQDKEEEYDEATKAILTKKNVTLAFIIVFYVLTAVFMAGAITSSEYEKYLVSDKYKAKLRRLEKVKKANKTV